MMKNWFPIPDRLLYGNREWRDLTPVAKILLLSCISDANRHHGLFFRDNLDWQVRLGENRGAIDRN